jgi:hypothetical protein
MSIAVSVDDRQVFWRRPGEPLLDREEVNAIFRYLMQMDAKLDEILELLDEDNGRAEEMDS